VVGEKEAIGETALALSGGGFRATLFHVGSLWRLNELGMLPGLKCVSSISGGAFVGALLGLRWSELGFDDGGVGKNLNDLVVEPLRKMCSIGVDAVPSYVNMAAMLFGGVTSGLEGGLRKHLFGADTLGDLPKEGEGPRFVFTVSNLQTGGWVWFSREGLREERLGALDSPDIPLAKALAASSGLPPFLSPVILKTDPSRWRESEGSDLFHKTGLRKRLILTDGGIQDPIGLDPILDENVYDTILVSDASVTREVWRTPSSFWIRQTGRSTILQTVSNGMARRRALRGGRFTNKRDRLVDFVWWCNADEIGSYGIVDALAKDSDETRKLCEIRTRLDRFTPVEQGRLINWGYALCDAALRRRFTRDAETSLTPPQWPFPEYAF